MKTDRSQHAKELVEKIGVVAEKVGFQPAVGRVIACLMVSDPPQMTFDEIQQYLGISKSAVSNALNALESRDMVDYITMPGDRKRYFRLTISGWQSQMRRQMSLRSSFPDLLKEVLAARSNKHPEFNRTLQETIEFFVFMDKETKAALEKWDALKAKK